MVSCKSAKGGNIIFGMSVLVFLLRLRRRSRSIGKHDFYLTKCDLRKGGTGGEGSHDDDAHGAAVEGVVCR